MKAQIIDKTGKEKKSMDLPKNFSSEIRKDIVLKVFESQKREHSYGVMPGAGAGYSASGISRKKRHAWKVTYGKGISRIPRKIMSRHGASFNWVGATATNTRGGRTAHPPRSEKNQFRKINKKELLVALNSCFSASTNKDLWAKIYGIKMANLPLIVNEDVLKIKTKEFVAFLKTIFGKEYEKTLKIKTRRSGRGKTRGRKYRSTLGILFIIGDKEKMSRKGIDVVRVEDLEIADLTSNGNPGRLIAYSEAAIKEIGEKWKK
jgi:large subunit ribosomal protein L4e